MSLPGYDPILFNWTEPKNGLGSFILTPKTDSGIIDIHNDFDWTLTPVAGRQHIPKVILTEYRQTQSSELRGMLYSARGKTSDLAIAANVGAEPLKQVLQEAGATIKQATTNTTNAITEKIATGVTKGIGTSTRVLDKIKNKDLQEGLPDWAKGALAPYSGLYAVEETKFKYIFPFFSQESMMGINNTWTDAGDGGQFRNAMSQAGGGVAKVFGALLPSGSSTGGTGVSTSPVKGKSLLSKIGGAAMGAASGTIDVVQGLKNMALTSSAGAQATEKPQAFTGSSATETVDIDFYLYNTLDKPAGINVIKQNWEFCYLFTYQNLPNRKGINLLDAPSLYKVEVPGYKHLPLATLSGISIQNVGNVRLINIDTGEICSDGSVGANIKMIPEAYHVKITLTSVLKNARNLFLFNADPSQSINVTVSPGAGT